MTYRQAFSSFVRKLIITTLIVAGAAALIYQALPDAYYTPAFPFLLAFFAIATLLVFNFMLKALEKRPARFVNIFLLSTLLKLLAYMALMLTYSLINRNDARPFIVAFFILYIIYTIMEVVALLNANRHISGP